MPIFGCDHTLFRTEGGGLASGLVQLAGTEFPGSLPVPKAVRIFVEQGWPLLIFG